VEPFTLESVLDEVGRWMNERISLFARQWQAIQEAKAAVPNTSKPRRMLAARHSGHSTHDYLSLRPTQSVPRCADKDTPRLESTRIQ